jgi:hypothetical protein
MSTDSHPPPQEQKQQRPLRVAVLTSGGDSAGMNAAVRAVVKQAIVRYLIHSSFFLEIFLFGNIYLYLPLESGGIQTDGLRTGVAKPTLFGKATKDLYGEMMRL